jgi:hypothetical protein
MLRGWGRATLAVVCILLAGVWGSTTGWAAGTERLRNDVREVVAGLKPTGRLAGGRRLRLAISLPLRDEAGLTELLRELHDPASPNYRRYLTAGQFAARFGPTQGDYDAMAAFARGRGLTVTRRHSNRLILDVEGAVSDIEKTLHVTMRTYQHPREGRQFFAPDADPTIDNVPGPILHISGLDDYALARPNLHREPGAALVNAAGAKAGRGNAAGVAATGTGGGEAATGNVKPNTGSEYGAYVSSDFRAAYVPGTALTGSGQSVALVEYDGYFPFDISLYESFFGVPNVPLVNVPVDGGVPTVGDNNDEVALDIEMAMSMAPGLSNIHVYEAPNPSPWVDMLNQIATDDLARQISCSWTGGDPDPASEQVFQEMAAQGQSFFQACGDSDALMGPVSFPADSPNITIVGATTLSTTGAGGAYTSETVWNWGNGVGGSGGTSAYYTIPPWQQIVSMASNQGSIYFRNVPDVAMVGDNVWVQFDDGIGTAFGGTSCAAPLWAGFTALANEQAAANGQGAVGFLNPTVYAIGTGTNYTAAFNDVTMGNNFSPASPAMFSAVQGYDLCTGWGSPAGSALINDLAGPVDALAISDGSFIATGTAGGMFTPGSQSFALANSGTASLIWTASATQPWVTLSATCGAIGASGTGALIASINGDATTLPNGNYYDTITFTDLATGVQQTRPVALLISSPAAVLRMTQPDNEYNPTGLPGGPFAPASASYLVENVGNAPMSWGVGDTAGWIVTTPTGGTLEAGGSASVTASVDGSINSLATGDYPDTLVFTNLANGAGNTSAPLDITVLPFPPVITSAATATGIAGTQFSYQIMATNGPTNYSAVGLPAGIHINDSTGLIIGTGSAPGMTTVALSASNAGGTGTASLTIFLNDSFASWQGRHFSPSQLVKASLSGSTSSAAGDGIPNVLKYAFNLNPFTCGVTGLPTGSVMPLGGRNYLALTYTQFIFASDLVFTPEVSTDMRTWNPGPEFLIPISVTNNPDGATQTVVVLDLTPMGPGTPQFMRLEVTLE